MKEMASFEYVLIEFLNCTLVSLYIGKIKIQTIFKKSQEDL